MRILISNDDGIEAEGLQALAKALAGQHEVVLAAPARQQSGMAHALTVHSDIEAAQYKDLEDMGITGWKIDGTPTDCVKLYLEALCEKDEKPDLVLSGINQGANLGSDVLYSGTVGAAMEGYMHGIFSIAVSLDFFSKMPFSEAAAIFANELPKLMEREAEPAFLNVNFPQILAEGEPKFVYGSVGHRDYLNAFERIERDGKLFFHVGGEIYDGYNAMDSDISICNHGRIAVSPLMIDMTDYEALKKYREND